jgi:hypothetical protein
MAKLSTSRGIDPTRLACAPKASGMTSERVDPDASSYDVFSIYGALMQEVQSFELSLAGLALVVEIDPNSVSNASLERQLKKAIKRGRHAFQAGSPAASRNRLEAKIPDDLYSEIDQLIPHRNRLAHRFLIERMIDAEDGPRFKSGTALEIVQYARRFGAANKRVVAETERIAADSPDTPAEILPIIDRLARAIVFDEKSVS